MNLFFVLFFFPGFNNRMLIDYAPFNHETVIAIESFLSDFQKPMCFIGKILFRIHLNFTNTNF